GTIRLNLVNDTGLSPTLANEPFNTGDTYNIDKSPPTINISSIINSPTNVSPIPLTITASENITGLDFTDFNVTNGSIANFAGSGQNYTANLIPTNNGTVNVTVNANSFLDAVNNSNTAPSSFVIQYDNVAPVVSGINRSNPNTQITNVNTVTFRVVFSEAVSGVDLTDFSIATTGNVQGNLSGFSSLGSLFYNVTVNNISGAGTLSITLKNSGTSIVDNSGNAITSGFSAGQTYIINNEPSFSLSSPQNQTICQNSGFYQLNNLLTVSDIDVGQTLTWSIVTGPTNGILAGFNATSSSNGGTVTPNGLSYTPNSSFAGIETFTIRVSDGVTSRDMVFNITVTTLPNISISPVQTLCEGQNITLTSTGGGNYSWTGPDGFVSTLQNPSITGATSNKSGTYSLTVTANGCTTSATTAVTVNVLPNITINSNQNICEGNLINLTSSGGGDYSWTGPSGFTSTSQNPTINSSNVLNTGVYSLTITTNGCTASATTSVTVNPIPTLTASANQTLCEGEAINLAATGSGDFSWSGPNGFSSLIQNPTINAATLNQSGIYSVTLSLNGCSSSATTSITVNSLPIITINSSLTICEGSSINLTSTGGGDYSWTGPNGFTSTSQNPTINSANVINTGVYSLTITSNGCTASATTSVTVNPIPTLTAGANQTLCEGNAINLTSTGSGDFSWSGPNGFSSLIQNPTISVASLNQSGIYTVTLSLNGCSSSATTSITVNSLPIITINSSSTICEGSSINLTSTGGGDYSWSGPNGFVSTSQNPIITSSTDDNQGVYTLTVTTNGCTSTATTSVTITPVPSISTNSNLTVCVGSPINLNGNGGGTYAWTGPNTFSSAAQNPVISSASLNNSGVYTLTVTSGICVVTATTSVTVNPLPNIIINSNLTLCSGSPINLTASGGADYAWSGPNGFTSILQNPTIATSTMSNSGNYSVSVTNIGCTAMATTNVTVNTVPAAPVSGTQNVCAGGNLNLTTTCLGGSVPVWFTDLTGLNSIGANLTNVTANTTYYVACELNSCRSVIIPHQVSIDNTISYNYSFNYIENVFGCDNGNVKIPLYLANTAGMSFQWQLNTGAGFNDILASSNYSDVTNDTLQISGLNLSMNNYLYRAVISNSCNSIVSDTFRLAINVLPSIVSSPTGQSVCVGNKITLGVQANGTGVSYRWQVNKGNGFEYLSTDNNYENVNSAQLLIKNIPFSFNNYEYRCQVFSSCLSIFSNTATLQVDPTITVLGQPVNKTICQNNSTTFNVSAVHIGGGSVSYQWQISFNGINYSNLSNNTVYQGVTTYTLSLSNVQMNLNNAKFRCLINNYCQTIDAVLNVIPVVTITSNPSTVTICEGNFANFTVTAAGQGLTYRWQVNTGAGFVNIYDGTYYQGATAATLQLFGATTSMNGYQYRCVVSGTSTCDAVSRETSTAVLNISVSPEAQNIVALSQISTGTTIYQATEYVLGLNKILSPARAEYRAGNAILLNPGFEVSAGAVFNAKIQNPCNLPTTSNFNLPKTITK
ncbi:beta strand repeat-containing protein, partial [Lacihabitans soyangensis]